MNSHDLAKILLEAPNLPVATHANNHTASHKNIKVGLLKSSGGKAGTADSVVIGNMSRRRVNFPNEYIVDMVHGELVEDW
ncbi:MAG: hypothetical protein V3T23_12435 [Nitrososphaerales archaeon]